jgi:hypothetical protein
MQLGYPGVYGRIILKLILKIQSSVIAISFHAITNPADIISKTNVSLHIRKISVSIMKSQINIKVQNDNPFSKL